MSQIPNQGPALTSLYIIKYLFFLKLLKPSTNALKGRPLPLLKIGTVLPLISFIFLFKIPTTSKVVFLFSKRQSPVCVCVCVEPQGFQRFCSCSFYSFFLLYFLTFYFPPSYTTLIQKQLLFVFTYYCYS